MKCGMYRLNITRKINKNKYILSLYLKNIIMYDEITGTQAFKTVCH